MAKSLPSTKPVEKKTFDNASVYDGHMFAKGFIVLHPSPLKGLKPSEHVARPK